MHFLESARKHFKMVPFVHEVGATIACEYFNEVNFRRGSENRAFVLVTAGPGLTNTITGISGAFLESRELLVIGGQVKTSDLKSPKMRQRGIQEIDGIQLTKSISKKSPTTFIFNNPFKISQYVSSNNNSIGFRVPNDNFCLELLNKFGRPIVSTSANISGIDIPLEFNLISSEIKSKVDYIVNYGKNKESHTASTILKIDEKGLITKLR